MLFGISWKNKLRINIYTCILVGLLTGQGTLDKFSFERLQWHIKHINNGTLEVNDKFDN